MALRWLTVDRLIMLIAWILLFTLAYQQTSIQSDTWWQIRAGQQILQSGQVPTQDSYSWTFPNAYWPNHEWLAEVIFYGSYALGGTPLLLLACAALITLTWVCLFLIGDGQALIRLIVIAIGISGHILIWSARPHLFSLLFLAVTLLLLNRPRRHWLYPLLFLVWANTHANVAVGGVVLGAACITAVIIERRINWRWLIVSAASAGATLINPLGFGLWEYVLYAFRDPARGQILKSEWLPPSLDFPQSYPFFGIALLWIAAIWLKRRQPKTHADWTILLVSIIFFILGLQSIRHTALFIVAAIPIMMPHWPVKQPATPPRVLIGAGSLIVLIGVIAWSGIQLITFWNDHRNDQAMSPSMIQAVQSCNGNLFNTYEAGGMLIWMLPERKIFIDNRQDPYPIEFLAQVANTQMNGDYRALFASYRISCAVMEADLPLFNALQRDGWQELYRDSQWAVLRQQ